MKEKKNKKKINEKQNINSFKEILASIELTDEEEIKLLKKIKEDEVKKMYKNEEKINKKIQELSEKIINEIIEDLKKENKLKKEK